MKWFSKTVKEYASAIHRLTCHSNHTDMCGWFGCGIDEINEQYRAENFYPDALKMSNELAGICTPAELHTIADIIRPSTKEWRKYDNFSS
jgi:hypothetical protein